MKNKKIISIETKLTIILVLSVLEVVLYIVLKTGGPYKGSPVLCKLMCTITNQYSFILEIVNDFCLAYIMSYIFYIVALIPERRRQRSLDKYVSIYLLNISRLLDEIIQISNSFANAGEQSLAKSPEIETILLQDTSRYKYLTYREHFVKFYQQFKDEYQHVMYYIAFIDDEIRDCLYEIVTCDFLNHINSLLINVNNSKCNEQFEKNFNITVISKLYTELKRLLEKGA